ncbi:hypothetical protein GLAREA_04306 [Glarea lozoyensis ATCC 20868]|uniref:Uncharacterized protein n=1 Tax=Glarea lozoyensis (strain ATCC 20868 / MF5171) TaxID=1116229 RepID=S3CP80_GLAL2|nr:uncharacterized protein GLAREA_04306 [Glarea lozoyensis ATCC 20868]EPE27515.1 hypothetical protein GLAREA_04306 [Glarea lozoyensis ATCC 20868]
MSSGLRRRRGTSPPPQTLSEKPPPPQNQRFSEKRTPRQKKIFFSKVASPQARSNLPTRNALVKFDWKSTRKMTRCQVFAIRQKHLFSQTEDPFSDLYQLIDYSDIRVLGTQSSNPFPAHSISLDEVGTKIYACSISEERTTNLTFFYPGLSNRGLDWQQAKWYDVVSHGWEAKRADKLQNIVSGLRASLKEPKCRDTSKAPSSKIFNASVNSILGWERNRNREAEVATFPLRPSLSTTAGYQGMAFGQNVPESERLNHYYLAFRNTEIGKRFVAMESESIIGLGELDTRKAFAVGWCAYTHSGNFTGVTGVLRRSALLRNRISVIYENMCKIENTIEAKFGADTKVAYSLSVSEASDLQKKRLSYERAIATYYEWNKTLSMLEDPKHEELNYWFFR